MLHATPGSGTHVGRVFGYGVAKIYCMHGFCLALGPCQQDKTTETSIVFFDGNLLEDIETSSTSLHREHVLSTQLILDAIFEWLKLRPETILRCYNEVFFEAGVG